MRPCPSSRVHRGLERCLTQRMSKRSALTSRSPRHPWTLNHNVTPKPAQVRQGKQRDQSYPYYQSPKWVSMSTNVDLRIPTWFPSTIVVEAYREVLGYRAVIRQLKRCGAIADAQCKPMRIDPQRLRDSMPTVFHRCVELIVEQRLASAMARKE